VARQARAPKLVTVEPIGAVTTAAVPIPVVAMYRWAPPFGDESPHPAAALAVGWTTSQVLVRGQRPASGEVWLPARDVHRVSPVPARRSVTARTTWRGAASVEVPAVVLAQATARGGVVVAVRVLLAPGTDEAAERWLLASDLVDEDPLDDVAG
jgi:hypothetical protein